MCVLYLPKLQLASGKRYKETWVLFNYGTNWLNFELRTINYILHNSIYGIYIYIGYQGTLLYRRESNMKGIADWHHFICFVFRLAVSISFIYYRVSKKKNPNREEVFICKGRALLIRV